MLRYIVVTILSLLAVSTLSFLLIIFSLFGFDYISSSAHV